MAGAGDQVSWRRSSRCEAGACVEVAITDCEVLLRQSGHPDGPILVVTRSVWVAFLDAIRVGEITDGDVI
jgi:hypothetical protein